MGSCKWSTDVGRSWKDGGRQRPAPPEGPAGAGEEGSTGPGDRGWLIPSCLPPQPKALACCWWDCQGLLTRPSRGMGSRPKPREAADGGSRVNTPSAVVATLWEHSGTWVSPSLAQPPAGQVTLGKSFKLLRLRFLTLRCWQDSRRQGVQRAGTAALRPGSCFIYYYGHIFIHSFILETPFCLPFARHMGGGEWKVPDHLGLPF